MTWGLSLSEISRIRRKRKKIWSIFIGWENHNTQENQTWHWGWSFHCTRPWSSGRSGGSRCICPHPRMLLLFSRLVVSDSLWPMDCSMPGFPVLHHFLKLAQTRVHWVGDAIQPSHPLSFPSLLPLIFPSIRIFSNESALHIRWPEYWSFSFSINPSNEYSGLISSRIDWFDFLRVQGTLKSLFQHHSSKAINSSAFSLLYGPALTFIHDYWKSQDELSAYL